MKVYHGSNVRIEKIDLTKSGAFKDFGQGFYVTNIRKHAYQRALDMTARYGNKPVVTEFEYHEAYPITMKMPVKRFENVSEEWVNFVIINRDEAIYHPAHTYSIVEGPIADDWITLQIERYKKGKIQIGKLIEKLKYREQTHQICFCTAESLLALENIDDNAIFDIEDISANVIETLMTEQNMEEKEAVKYFYTSTVYAQLADIDTLLYKENWRKLYEMLNAELDTVLR